MIFPKTYKNLCEKISHFFNLGKFFKHFQPTKFYGKVTVHQSKLLHRNIWVGMMVVPFRFLEVIKSFLLRIYEEAYILK